MSGPAFDTWLPVPAPGGDPLSLLVTGQEQLRALYDGLWDRGVDPVTLELCRLRLAMLVDSPADLSFRDDRAVAAGLTEEVVTALRDWPSSPMFTEDQRAALGFAEQYTIDPHGVTDEDAAVMQRHFSGPQIAALTIALATFDALARVRALLKES